jgi:hypothetical protein
VDEIPQEARAVEHTVLAHGEPTGLMHTVLAGAEQLVTPDRARYVRVHAALADLVHQ